MISCLAILKFKIGVLKYIILFSYSLLVAHLKCFALFFFFFFFCLGEQKDAVDNLITAMDLTDAQRWDYEVKFISIILNTV